MTLKYTEPIYSYRFTIPADAVDATTGRPRSVPLQVTELFQLMNEPEN